VRADQEIDCFFCVVPWHHIQVLLMSVMSLTLSSIAINIGNIATHLAMIADNH
jgi:hypothetical protein